MARAWWKQEKHRALCVDCGVDTIEVGHHYMVHDGLWAAARMGDGMLCLGCLEARINRPLIRDDFDAIMPSAWAAWLLSRGRSLRQV